MSLRVRVTLRNFSVRTPERPTPQESGPFRRMLSTRIGSLKSVPETTCPSERGRADSWAAEVSVEAMSTYITCRNQFLGWSDTHQRRWHGSFSECRNSTQLPVDSG